MKSLPSRYSAAIYTVEVRTPVMDHHLISTDQCLEHWDDSANGQLDNDVPPK
jgi:hypothetical protein